MMARTCLSPGHPRPRVERIFHSQRYSLEDSKEYIRQGMALFRPGQDMGRLALYFHRFSADDSWGT